jgi:hypothetical protein
MYIIVQVIAQEKLGPAHSYVQRKDYISIYLCRDSSVGVATSYVLGGRQLGIRVPVVVKCSSL